MAKKRKAAARRRASRKPAARRRRAKNPDATINALVILVVIVMVLGGLYLYVQNKKQAALAPALGHAVASLVAPVLTPLPAALGPMPPAVIAQAPQASTQTLEPAAGADAPRPVAAAEPQ
jgi:hypothetical protein